MISETVIEPDGHYVRTREDKARGGENQKRWQRMGYR